MNAHYKAVSTWTNNPNIKPLVTRPKYIDGVQLTILGCGTSSGIPLIACRCTTCQSLDPKNNRLRASAYIRIEDKAFLIDTSPDLRIQALKYKLKWIDAVLFTHPHADHIHGIDDLRSFNFVMRQGIPCYGNRWTISALHTKFDYIFKMTQEGGGKPIIDLHLINGPTKITNIPVQPLKLIHGKVEVLGYRIKDIAYITDCSYIPSETLKKLHNLDVLVLDCLRPKPHSTHLNIEQSIELAKKINAKRTYFTHMGHEIEYHAFAKSLPKGMKPAYDGLVIKSF